MSLNHRTRLALISATAAGTILALLFTAVVVFARRDVLGDKRTELRAVMRSFTAPTEGRFDLQEFRGAHPELSASVFDESGRLVESAGWHPLMPEQGYGVQHGWLSLGDRFRGQTIVIALDLQEMERSLGLLTAALVVTWLPLTLLVGGVTWMAAQSVFRPLERLSGQALAMSGANLSERLETLDQAEFGHFATNLNQMLDRIEETVRRGERFSADAAHELRTPLAIMRTRLETALIQERSPVQYQATLARSIVEIERLTAIVESLLRTARGVSMPAPPLDVRPIVEGIAHRWHDRFVERAIRLETSLEPASIAILPDEIEIVLDNLLGNALRYAPADSTVRLTLGVERDTICLTVTDQGPGVPPELGETIFDRFVRADDSRNRASGGAGIGLSVCRGIVEGRGGKMILKPERPHGVTIGCGFPQVDSTLSVV